jgi:hypothetical protein
VVVKPGVLHPHPPRHRRPDHHRAHPVLPAPTRPRHPEAGAHLGQPAPGRADRIAADRHGAVILNRHGAVILNGEVRSRLLGFSARSLVGFSAVLYVQCQRASLVLRVNTDYPLLGGTLLRPRLGRVAPSDGYCRRNRGIFGSGALHNELSHYRPKPYNLCWSPNSALLGHGCGDRPNRCDLVGTLTGPSRRSVGPSPPWRSPRC